MKKDEIKELTDAFIAKTQEMEYPKKNPEDPFRQYWNGVSDAVEVMMETLKEMTDDYSADEKAVDSWNRRNADMRGDADEE